MAATSELIAVSAAKSPKAPVGTTKKGSYGQILTSSALVGAHLLLGPAGLGLFGLFGSVADLSQNIAGMGVNSSGVRQIAEAVGSSDDERIAETVAVLRRTSVVLGLMGAALVASLSRQISVLRLAVQTMLLQLHYCRLPFSSRCPDVFAHCAGREILLKGAGVFPTTAHRAPRKTVHVLEVQNDARQQRSWAS